VKRTRLDGAVQPALCTVGAGGGTVVNGPALAEPVYLSQFSTTWDRDRLVVRYANPDVDDVEVWALGHEDALTIATTDRRSKAAPASTTLVYTRR
jgi:hypothetical protein